MERPLETLAKRERRFCSLPECKHQKGSGRFLPEPNHHRPRYNWSVPGQTFDKDPSCVCGHSFEDRSHIIYDCPEWEKIRRRFFLQITRSVRHGSMDAAEDRGDRPSHAPVVLGWATLDLLWQHCSLVSCASLTGR
ncbi:hypothetical protein CEXT_364961 [Caerostris extrusa]|uniref:Reverse transcriptase n=1 Tax=Caerostris extrusa TaxID=172846 RepID=A0AAV4QVY2_CAEEX|nr:hypothetical protein CEXT_364961 [Caerostris extrusa]